MPRDSWSSLAAFPFALGFVTVEASVATDSTDVSPSCARLAGFSAFEGMETVASPAGVEDVDFRGMISEVRAGRVEQAHCGTEVEFPAMDTTRASHQHPTVWLKTRKYDAGCAQN